MSDPDVDAVQRFYAAWTAGDLPGMLEQVDPAVEAEPVLGLLFKRPTFRGHSGIADWFEEVADLWDGFEAQVEGTHRVDGGVVCLLRLVATIRGRSSDARIAVVCTFRDGKILRFRGRDREELLDELGLPG